MQHCRRQQCEASANADCAVSALLPVSAWQHSSEHSLVALMPDADGLAASARHRFVVLNPGGEMEGTRLPARDARVIAEASATQKEGGVAAARDRGPAARLETDSQQLLRPLCRHALTKVAKQQRRCGQGSDLQLSGLHERQQAPLQHAHSDTHGTHC